MPTLMALAARMLPYILLALVVVAGYQYITSQARSGALLEVQVQTQTEALATQDATIQNLKAEVSRNAQLALQAQTYADTQAAKLAKVTNTLREIMKDEPCRNVQLPAAAVDRLRLSADGKD